MSDPTTTQARARPFTESWRATVLRTGGIALAIGAVPALVQRRLDVLPRVALFALWFTLGGHLVEMLFLNHVARLVAGRAAWVVARLACWLVGGSLLYAGALATRALLPGRTPPAGPLWLGGVGLIAIELAVHGLLRASGRASFFDGPGK